MKTCFPLMFALSIAVSAAAQDPSTVFTYKTDKAPEIDGEISLGEWDAAGPATVVVAEAGGSAFPDDPFGGPPDASFQYRTMWVEPWTAYFLFEITDDIPMDIIPGNRWEMDQLELFFDGNDLEGNDVLEEFQWWDHDEPYGKFGASRWEGEFEGNPAVMSTFIEDLYSDGQGAFAVTMVTETGNNADYIIEYAVSFEPMFDNGVFDGTPTGDAEQIVAGETVIKWRACLSDDDDFGDGTVGRSNTVCSIDTPDWRDTTAFADLTFVGPLVANVIGLQAGDADEDLDFDQLDLVKVQIAAKYLSGTAATWGEGDWNGAPGGEVGNPPAGNGLFDQLDIIAALAADVYLKGPYAAIAQNGSAGDGQSSLVYDAGTGELRVDAPADTNFTSINITSAGGLFVGGGELGNVDLIHIPEPTACLIFSLGMLVLLSVRQRQDNR